MKSQTGKTKLVDALDIRKFPKKFTDLRDDMLKEYYLKLDIANYLGITDKQILEFALYQMSQRHIEYDKNEQGILFNFILGVLPRLKKFESTYTITGPELKLLTATYSIR